jgi:tetratricopeptide (TPR) repeat protein
MRAIIMGICIFVEVILFAQSFETYYNKALDSIEAYNFSAALLILHDASRTITIERDSLYTQQAYCYAMLKDYETAIKLCNRAIALNNENAFAYYVKGYAVLNHPISYQERDSLWDKIMNAANGRKLLLNYKMASEGYGGDLYNYGRARLLFLNAISIEPDFADAYYFMGYSFEEVNRYDTATHYYSKAIAFKPDENEYYIRRGTMYRFRQKFAEAMEDYNKAIELDSTDYIAYVNRAYLKEKQNNQQGACKDYKRAMELGYFVRNYFTTCANQY